MLSYAELTQAVHFGQSVVALAASSGMGPPGVPLWPVVAEVASGQHWRLRGTQPLAVPAYPSNALPSGSDQLLVITMAVCAPCAQVTVEQSELSRLRSRSRLGATSQASEHRHADDAVVSTPPVGSLAPPA